MTAPDTYPPEIGVGVTRDRVMHLTPAARTLHQIILRWFADNGRAPDLAELSGSVPGHSAEALLDELHDRDVVRLDENGHIRAAYPFSATATGHVVSIEGGPAMYAMCAVDALGIAEMLDRDIVVTSTDPGSGEAITIRIHSGRPVWNPAGTVVYVGSLTDPDEPGDSRCSAAADRCCGVMNFFASDESAAAWQQSHPEATGVVLTGPQALQLGIDIFGALLND